MLFSTILLASTLQQDLPVGLALCVVPFVLGWAFAYFFHKVSDLQLQVRQLTEDKTALTKKVNEQAEEITDQRVRLTQAEAEIHDQRSTISHLRSNLLVAEHELKALKEAAEAAAEGDGKGKK